MLHSICQQIWETAVATGLTKVSFHSNPKKSNAKKCSNYCTTALISHASKVMLKILLADFNSTWTENFQMFKLDLEKAEEQAIKLPISVGSLKNQESFRKTSTSASLTTPNTLTVYIRTNCGKLFKRQEHKTGSCWKLLAYLAPEKSVCRSRSIWMQSSKE